MSMPFTVSRTTSNGPPGPVSSCSTSALVGTMYPLIRSVGASCHGLQRRDPLRPAGRVRGHGCGYMSHWSCAAPRAIPPGTLADASACGAVHGRPVTGCVVQVTPHRRRRSDGGYSRLRRCTPLGVPLVEKAPVGHSEEGDAVLAVVGEGGRAPAEARRAPGPHAMGDVLGIIQSQLGEQGDGLVP